MCCHAPCSLATLQLGAAFPWYPLFTAPSSTANATDDTSLPGNLPSQHAIEYTDLQYERCNLLMNVAAAYISMANKEDRSTLEGTKRAIGHFQVSMSNGWIMPGKSRERWLMRPFTPGPMLAWNHLPRLPLEPSPISGRQFYLYYPCPRMILHHRPQICLLRR